MTSINLKKLQNRENVEREGVSAGPTNHTPGNVATQECLDFGPRVLHNALRSNLSLRRLQKSV